MVAYLAAILKGQTLLLPPNQASGTLSRLRADYPDSYCIGDRQAACKDSNFIVDWTLLGGELKGFPQIDVRRTLSIAFTSGSTGDPKAIAKNWQEFQLSAELALQRLDLQDKALTLISTVPMQHMYGLETSFFWPLFSSLRIHDSRPFYPQDIRTLLKTVEAAMLVSTPTHLKSCVNSDGDWPNVSRVLSSTAPMSFALAENIEQRFDAPLFEIYGSTETLSFAARRPLLSAQWQPYQGIRLHEKRKRFFVEGGHLSGAHRLGDSFEIAKDGSFKSLGRCSDLIKIAGKRASLNELNRILEQLPTVEDGIFFKTRGGRLAALVVSDAIKQDIISGLKHSMDEVFLPRNIYQVSKLPRNETGKIIKAELDSLIQGLKRA